MHPDAWRQKRILVINPGQILNEFMSRWCVHVCGRKYSDLNVKKRKKE